MPFEGYKIMIFIPIASKKANASDLMATISLLFLQIGLIYIGVKVKGGRTNYTLWEDRHGTKCKRNYKEASMCSAILWVKRDLVALSTIFKNKDLKKNRIQVNSLTYYQEMLYFWTMEARF